MLIEGAIQFAVSRHASEPLAQVIPDLLTRYSMLDQRGQKVWQAVTGRSIREPKSVWESRIDIESVEIDDPEPDGTRPLQVRFSKDRYKLLEDGSVRDIQTNDVFPAEVWKSAISQILNAVANGPTVKSPERRDLYEWLQERSEAIGYALEHPEVRCPSSSRQRP